MIGTVTVVRGGDAELVRLSHASELLIGLETLPLRLPFQHSRGAHLSPAQMGRPQSRSLASTHRTWTNNACVEFFVA